VTALQKVKEIEARKAEYVAVKERIDAHLRAARLAGGTTAAMRAEAQQIQLKIEDVNRELARVNLDLLSITAGTELSKCPFCGSIAALTHDVLRKGYKRDGVVPKLWYVVCVNPRCACHLHKKFSPTEAVRVWQERVKMLSP